MCFACVNVKEAVGARDGALWLHWQRTSLYVVDG
jgi:hypothetical protein